MSSNRQTRSVQVHKFNLNQALPENITSQIVKAVNLCFDIEKVKSSCEISVILTSDEEITKLNKKYLSKNTPTDVLCFPYATGKTIKADIFISVDRAREQAHQYNHSHNQEILFLVLHGILHLLDWKDNSPRERQQMLNKQKSLLALIDI